MTIPPILKNKWALLGGGAVILIALVAGGRGSAASNVMVASGPASPSDAQVMASRDITIAQLNAQSQSNAVNGQIALAQATGNIELAQAGMDAKLSQYAIDAQLAIQSLQAKTSTDIQLSAIASSDRQALAAINQQSQIAKWTLDQATMNTEIQTDFQLQYAEAANTTQVYMAQMQSALVGQQLAVGRDVQLAGLASQENMAAINASLQRDVTYSNNSTQQAVYEAMVRGTTAQAQIGADITMAGFNQQTEQFRIGSNADITKAQLAADVAKTQSYNDRNVAKDKATKGLLGGVIGAIGSIFSDPRLKTNVVKIGEFEDGLGLYHYNVPWAEATQHGVMSNEVAELRPYALGPVIDGFQTVNYGALNG